MIGPNSEPRCYILDTGAFALYFGGDERVKPFFDEIFDGKKRGVTCELVLGEFWYKTCQVLGKDVADDFYRRIRASNIVIVGEDEVLMEAARLKCAYRDKLSFVDCHVLALANSLGGKIITTDPAFKEIRGVEVVYIEVSRKRRSER